MDSRARHRVLLSLRSESALGLQFTEASAMGLSAADDRTGPVAGHGRPRSGCRRRDGRRATGAVRHASRGHEHPGRDVVAGRAAAAGAPNCSTTTRSRAAPKCRLSETRTRTVFGEGNPEAAIFFVGEGPGENEDQTGRAVRRAGGAVAGQDDRRAWGWGGTRSTSPTSASAGRRATGCRPRTTAAACMPYLVRQLEVVRPKVIVTLGLTAAKYMLGDNKLAMGKIRGQWTHWRGVRADADVPPGVRPADADGTREAGRLGRPQGGPGRGRACTAHRSQGLASVGLSADAGHCRPV